MVESELSGQSRKLKARKEKESRTGNVQQEGVWRTRMVMRDGLEQRVMIYVQTNVIQIPASLCAN